MMTPDDARAAAAGAAHPAVAALAEGGPDGAAVGAFMAAHEFPLAEPGFLTFAWRGEGARVELLRWIRGGVDRDDFAHVPGTDLWLLRLAAEDRGRFEYKLAVHAHGHEHWINDPANPARAGDPFGENSVARSYGYVRPDWAEPQGAPEGSIVEIEVQSASFGETRSEHVYLPAGHDKDRPYKLVVIHDGADFVTYANLKVVLDNLIDAGDIPPVVAALVQTGDRMGEYPRGRRHARYLAQDLLPALAARFRLSERPEDRVLLGASLGAVASLSAAFRYPGVFGGLVLQSGSFVLDAARLAERPHPVFQRTARLVRALRRAAPLPATRAYVSTGELEGLADDNRALAEVLREQGAEVLFESAWDGHHWHNWRDRLRAGLRWVFVETGPA